MKSRIAAWFSDIATRFAGLYAGSNSGKRALVHEILSIQVFSATLVGFLAIASLYWGGQWILQDNYSRWALQWTDQLNELGSPLYLAEDQEIRVSLDNFVERYPEIDQVVYYATDGTVLHAVDSSDDMDPVENLTDWQLQDAIDVVGQDEPYLMSGGLLDPRQFNILAPVWVESIPDDGLFGFDAKALEAESRRNCWALSA